LIWFSIFERSNQQGIAHLHAVKRLIRPHQRAIEQMLLRSQDGGLWYEQRVSDALCCAAFDCGRERRNHAVSDDELCLQFLHELVEECDGCE
jgi:hypothetical protein